MTVGTWQRIQRVVVPVLVIGWAVFVIQVIRGEADTGSPLLVALYVGNLALVLGGIYVDRQERQRG